MGSVAPAVESFLVRNITAVSKSLQYVCVKCKACVRDITMHTLNDTLNLDHVDTSEAEQLYPITDHIYI